MSGKRRGGWILVWVLGFVMGLVSAQVSNAGTGAPDPAASPGAEPSAALHGRRPTESGQPVKPVKPVRQPRDDQLGAMRFVTTYDFEVDIDAARGSASVVERLVVTNRSDTEVAKLNLFVLPHFQAAGFRELELGALTVEGRPVDTAWTEEGANLIVSLPRPLAPGSVTSLDIRFTLHPGGAVGANLPSAVSKAGGTLQFLLWYPMLSDGHGARLNGDNATALPASTVTYSIRSTAPLTFAVPGTVTERTDRSVRGRVDAARDLAFAAGPHFRTWTRKSDGGVTVRAYADAMAAGGAATDVASAALDAYAELLGTPYPSSELVIVGGTMDMESSGIVFLKQEDLENPYAVRHEVAHEWFHWLVGNDQVREPWLDEALATYLAGGLQPRQADGYCSSRPVDSPVQAFASADPAASWRACDSYVQTIYYKGSWLLEAVRVAMGDAAFVAALRDYVATFRFRVATTGDLVATLQGHSPAVTDELLALWLWSAGPGSLPAPTNDPF